MTLLSVQYLTKAFGGNEVVRGISFDVAAGEVVALIGPNGAGKTTCFNMLNGQIRPDSGMITLGGETITGWAPDRIWRFGVGRGFQIAATFGSMTVRDNVRTALLSRHRAVWRFFRPASDMFTAEAEALLDRVGLRGLAEQGCGTLAYGDLKRLELALAISNKPRLLLVDEPTAGMTPPDRRAVMDLLLGLAREGGCAVLFTEHDTDMVFRSADRILVMDKGELIAEGDAASIRANSRVRTAYLGDE
ncbi:MAG TPA: ABC transporter ATP-binding protein [Acetobacteraceae bacterium]|jgi:branched-chain amino acid transport system ATP-binding protein|nr:ABC transporter ATP-binding protein [Acetobacteraceae bacterium]